MEFGVHRAEGSSPITRGYKAPLNMHKSDSFQSVFTVQTVGILKLGKWNSLS